MTRKGACSRVGCSSLPVLNKLFRRIDQGGCLFSCAFCQQILKQDGIAGIAFEYCIRDIPEDRDQAYSSVEKEVTDH